MKMLWSLLSLLVPNWTFNDRCCLKIKLWFSTKMWNPYKMTKIVGTLITLFWFVCWPALIVGRKKSTNKQIKWRLTPVFWFPKKIWKTFGCHSGLYGKPWTWKQRRCFLLFLYTFWIWQVLSMFLYGFKCIPCLATWSVFFFRFNGWL